MEILLCGINAKYIHTNLAIRQIKGYVEQNSNYKVNLIEFTINNYINEILEGIYTHKPDVLGVSCYIWNIEIVKKLIVLIKKVLPNTILILGGPEVSYSSEEIISEIPVDFVISGEGEHTFLEIISCIDKKLPFDKIKGITYKNGNQIISNAKTSAIDMAKLPFPYSDFKDIENKICYYEASRGCPFGCKYCLSSIEKGVRFAPIEKVKKELKIFLDNKVQQVKFVDRTFNANKKFALEIINYIIENDNGFTNFHFEVESSILDDVTINTLSTARKGLFQLEIGVQSTNDNTLSVISRKNDIERLKKCLDVLQKNQNVHIHLDLIAGLPLEDLESFKKSFNDVYSLEPHQLQLGFLKVLKGSGMEKLCNEYDIKYSPFAPYEVLSTHCLSYDDILLLKGVEEMLEIYYNSNRFYHSIRYLIKFCENPFELFYKLSEYKNKKGTGSVVHNKQYAYTFLVEFSYQLDGIDLELLKSKLKLDYLCHEKPRSAPSWAEENLLDKKEIYNLVVREDKVSKLLPEYSDCDAKQLLKLIHIEKFSINPIKENESPVTLLFNYRKKNFWGNATTIQIE